jgi:hypothetical protein
MDDAYDVPEIRAAVSTLGHVPIIDKDLRNKEVKQERVNEKRGPKKR